MTEMYKLPNGKILISCCDVNLSIGLLELDPNQELSKHNRPVNEELVQIKGSSVMKLYDGDELKKEITLEEGSKLLIPANQDHVHSNPFDIPSVTHWKFEGNIIKVIDNIRNGFERIL